MRLLTAFIFALLIASPFAFAEDETMGWSWTIGCPESGGESPVSNFSSSTSSGFSGSGTCKRVGTRLTRFVFENFSGGTLMNSTLYGLHTGDVLLMQPALTSETKPNVAMTPACPVTTKPLIWIIAQWGAGERHPLTNFLMAGTANYNPATGLSVTSAYDVAGTQFFNGVIPLAGTCSNGIYALSGSGDRGGNVYFTLNGSGNFKASTGKATLYFPPVTVSLPQHFGNLTASGLMFNSAFGSDAKPIQVITGAGGNSWVIRSFLNPETGTLDGSYMYRAIITSANAPVPGMILGTIQRFGAGATPIGKLLCIVAEQTAKRFVCSAEGGADGTIPFSFAYSVEGPQLLGQPSGTSYMAIERGMASPGSVVSAGGKLYVADYGNHRVLGWNTVPTSNQTPPDFALGQPDTTSNNNAQGNTASTLFNPRSVASDGTRLLVTSFQQNRVLLWSTLPSSNNQPANIVLGQSSMTLALSNQGTAAPSASSLSGPKGVAIVGSRIFVADTANNRVLIWNSIPNTNGAPANIVLGQPNFTSKTANNGGVTGARMNQPLDVYSDGTKLYVADTGNNRVLVWNNIPTVNGQAANSVLGQPSVNATTANNGGISGARLSGPSSVYIHGGKLYVGDTNNCRILVYNTLPTANVFADFAIGQSDLTSSGCLASATTLLGPQGATTDGTKLYVADSQNNRVVIYGTLPTTFLPTATTVLGQMDMNSNGMNTPGVSSISMSGPSGVFSSGTRLLVADTTNHRVLLWNATPKSNQQAADLVLGQPGFITRTVNYPSGSNLTPTATSLNSPYSAISPDGNKIIVVDGANHRVLIWNAWPTANQQAADVVLGQPTMTARVANNGGVSAASLNSPNSAWVDSSGKLYVADTSNHRVLVWNSIPVVNQTPADYVLGQPNFTSMTANNGGGGMALATNLYSPKGVSGHGNYLFVADSINSRVLIWNTAITSNGQAANFVVGQNDFNSRDAGVEPAANNFGSPQSVAMEVAGSAIKFFVSDTGFNRILMWDFVPTNNEPARAVLGQPNFTSGTANNGGMTMRTLFMPRGISAQGQRLFVSDTNNNRVITYDSP